MQGKRVKEYFDHRGQTFIDALGARPLAFMQNQIRVFSGSLSLNAGRGR